MVIINNFMKNKQDVGNNILNNTQMSPQPNCSSTMNETMNGNNESRIRERIEKNGDVNV